MKEVFMYKRKAVGCHPIDFRCKTVSRCVRNAVQRIPVRENSNFIFMSYLLFLKVI